MSEVGDLKIRIVNALSHDANRSRKQISSELGISESYLSKLIRELTDEDQFIDKFTIKPNYGNLGYGAHYFSLISLGDQHSENVEKIANTIKNIPEAVEVYSVYGETDFFVRWVCRNGQDLMGMLKGVLDEKELSSIKTYALGEEYKRGFGPDLPEKGGLNN